jgi:hypothetical protein
VSARAAVLLSTAVLGLAWAAPPAAALNVCGALSWASGLAGKACNVVRHPDRLINGAKQLVTGHLGGAAKAVFGGGGGAVGSRLTAAAGLAAIGAWVIGGASFALHETAKVLSTTTTPQLRSTWFSAAYWRMAGIAALLTLPFLFAAAVQALLRSDLALLVRATLGYLPLAMLAVSVAAPIAMLLLVASDQLSAIVS